MLTTFRRYALLCAAGCLLPALARGQDTNYWTEQYGNRARLLGGAVIGSADDLSAVYYNPGALALVDNAQLLLAGNVVQFERLKVDDSLGPGEDLSSSSFGGAPSLFAGELRLGFLGRSRLAYSFLTRQHLDLFAEQRDQVQGGDLFQIPGLSFYEASVSFDQSLSDYWAGLTWSLPLGDTFGIGVSPFVGVRNQQTRLHGLAQGLGANGRAGLAVNDREISYSDWRLLAKFGFAARYHRFTFGISLTTPSAHLFGSGQTSVDRTAVGQGIDVNGQPLTVLASDFQDGLSSDFASPLSVGAGGSYSFGRTTVHASVEWFQAVGERTLLDSVPFTPQTGGAPIPTAATYRLDGVLNAAVGVEHQFRPGLRGFAGLGTDFSGASSGTQGNSTVSFWDIYHVSTGATMTVGRTEVTLGAIGAFGGATTKRGFSLVPSQDAFGVPAGKDVDYFRLTFILGFNFDFK
jgi:hypothetical protein